MKVQFLWKKSFGSEHLMVCQYVVEDKTGYVDRTVISKPRSLVLIVWAGGLRVIYVCEDLVCFVFEAKTFD